MTEKQKNYQPGTYTGLGIALGTSIGFTVGLLVFNSSTTGAGVGFVLGLIFGNSLDKRKQK